MEFDYSIIVPAYNEEKLLPGTLDAVRRAMEAQTMRGELIVVDNASTDRTAGIAAEYGATVLFEPHRQISRARNAGGRNARGRFLFFLDADTILPPELLGKALSALDSEEFYGGGTLVRFDLDQLPWSVRFFTRFWNRIASRMGWAAGCFIFVRKEAFDDVGGFREDLYAAEEIYFSKAVRLWGRKRNRRFAFIDNPSIVTSSRKLDKGHLSILGTYLLLGLCPFLLRSRRICWPWYGNGS